MTYNFNCNGKIIKVWVWNGDHHTEVSIQTDKKSYDRTIRKDENGEKFFTWDKQKIYLKDYISCSMKELKERLETGEWLTSDDLVQSILHDGVENVRFECPLNPFVAIFPGGNLGLCNASEHVNTLCKITEKRYKVKSDYKIGVIPVNNPNVGSEDYYTSDMLSLIKSGHIKIIV